MRIVTKNAFTMLELMVVVLIFGFIMGGVYMSLSAGRDSWLTTDAKIQLNDNLRLTMERVAMELRQTGSAPGTPNPIMQLTITNAGGPNNSDVVRFSIPVVCSNAATIINTSGDVSYWGAPLTWGCTTYSCMDGDGVCATIEYKYIEYKLDNSQRLVRRVLDGNGAQVRQDVFANNISDFQLSLSADQNVVTMTVIALRNSGLNRQITATNTMNIFLRNRG